MACMPYARPWPNSRGDGQNSIDIPMAPSFNASNARKEGRKPGARNEGIGILGVARISRFSRKN